MTDVIEATVVDPGTELVPAQQPAASATLFHTDDPVEVVQKASVVAAALKDVLATQGMVQNIQGKEHVKVEGWQTLGSMLGVVPVVVWTKELDDGWECRVEARTLDGRVVGAAEAMCTRAERMWAKRDPYALRSMAQTRATSKALRGPLGFVVTLAGYDATPAEEIPREQPRRDFEHTGRSDVTPDAITPEQYQRAVELFKAAGSPVPALVGLLDQLNAPAGGVTDRVKALSSADAERLITALTDMVPPTGATT